MANPTQIKLNFDVVVNGQKQVVELSSDVKALGNALASVQPKTFTKGLTDWAEGMASVGFAFQTLRDNIAQLTQGYNDFDKSMRAANTMAGKDPAGFGRLKDQVKELSKEIPIARDQLANGLYQVISNGVPEDNWIEYLRSSARSSVGGIADVGEVVKVTSTIIKNYGMDWAEAGAIQDKIQLAAKNGVTSFEQLAAALPSVTGQAAQLGVSLDEMLAVMATLTGVTGNTSEVSTQLASVLTALTKESSKAQKQAAAMGIEFNAASVKAAGGLGNYLRELDATVTAYSNKTGQLKESIYSKLFGRAEALRLVNALTGQLSEKFDENVTLMDASLGTMDNAYENVANSAEAAAQKRKNIVESYTDEVAAVAKVIQPYLSYVAIVGQSMVTMSMLYKSVVGVGTALKGLATTKAMVALRGKLLLATNKVLGPVFTFTANAAQNMAVKFGLSATATKALTWALRGLAAATVVGAAIAGIAALLGAFSENADDAKQKANGLADGLDNLGTVEQQISKTASEAAAQESGKLRRLYAIAKDETKSRKERADAVRELQRDYPEYFKNLDAEHIAVDKLTKDYNACAKGILAKAKAKAYEEKIAKNMAQVADLEDQLETLRAQSEPNTSILTLPSGNTMEFNLDKIEPNPIEEGVKRTAAALIPTMESTIKRLEDEADGWAKKVDELNKEAVPDTSTHTSASSGDDKKNHSMKGKFYANPEEKSEYEHNIRTARAKLTGEETEEQRLLLENIKAWKNKVKEIEKVEAIMARPEELETLQDIDDELAYQQKIRKIASKEKIAGIDEEIKRLQALKKSVEDTGKKAPEIGEIKSYKDAEEAVRYYDEALKEATDDETRAKLMKQKEAVEELRASWEKAARAANAPDLKKLDTLAQVDKALSFYNDKMRDANEDERSEIAETIAMLEKKRTVMDRDSEILKMESDLEELQSLTSKEFKIKVREMGYDGLAAKIKECNRLLADTENPLTDKQREQVTALAKAYQDAQKKSHDYWDSFKSGYSSINSMTSAVKSAIDVWQQEGNVLDKLTTTISSFITVMDGIMAVVQIIKQLTTTTAVLSGVQEASVTANTEDAAAKVADATATAAAAAIAVPANKELAGSIAELAAANALNANSEIPVVGGALGAANAAAIAAAYVAAVASISSVVALAEGGIASKPTLALIGEYAGASHNPEVVAPLNKLRGMIRDESGGIGGRVTFRIDGRTLVGILEKESNLRSRR